MPKEKVTRHNICLFPGDLAKLQELYPDQRASLIIRTLVRQHILKVEGQAGQETPDVDIEV